MITKRIIPCLDVKDGRVVKGVNFKGLADVSSPVELGKYYSDNGADELVFYDITASAEGRALFTDILTEVAQKIFIPLTVGGGINTVEDFDRVLKCGADKVSVNSGAIKNPDLIYHAAKRYGDQCVVLSIDAKRVDGKFKVFAKGGRENTGYDLIEWVKRGVDNGAGEIVLNSIEFWTGKKALANTGEKKIVKNNEGKNVEITAMENGYNLTDGVTSMNFVFDEETQIWSAEYNNQSTDLIKIVDDNNAQLFLMNGEVMDVTLDAEGINMARMYMNNSFAMAK